MVNFLGILRSYCQWWLKCWYGKFLLDQWKQSKQFYHRVTSMTTGLHHWLYTEYKYLNQRLSGQKTPPCTQLTLSTEAIFPLLFFLFSETFSQPFCSYFCSADGQIFWLPSHLSLFIPGWMWPSYGKTVIKCMAWTMNQQPLPLCFHPLHHPAVGIMAFGNSMGMCVLFFKHNAEPAQRGAGGCW